jgi:hemolysin III
VGRVSDLVEPARPRLRGLLHLIACPIALIAGDILVALTRGVGNRLALTVYTVSAVLLFGTSAVYHRGRWTPTVSRWLRRLDHANIFLLIAGTYTAVAVLVLHGRVAVVLLAVLWPLAIIGIALRVCWPDAPRRTYVPVYVALGWIVIFVMPELLHRGGWLLLALLGLGGACYTLGAVVYGLRRPDPSPRTFGFHEVFHALTVAGFVAQYAALTLAVAR